MKSILATLFGISLCLMSSAQLASSMLLASLSKKETSLLLKDMAAYNRVVSDNDIRNNSMNGNTKKVVDKKTFTKTNKNTSTSLKSKARKEDAFFANYNPTLFENSSKADSFFKSHNENSFLIKYSRLDKGAFKYKFHIEGHLKNCTENSKVVHAYVSMNSALESDRYTIVATNADGYFSTDVDEDSVGSITIIKKGYPDKEIPLSKSLAINENTAYSFDVCMEKNENVPKVAVANKTKTVTAAPHIYFDFNKATLKDESMQALDDVVDNIKSLGNDMTTVQINGYTDKKGSDTYNLKLSKKRSLACKQYMEKRGLKNVKIIVNAFGSTSPENSSTEESNYDNGAKDRRVDIVILPHNQ